MNRTAHASVPSPMSYRIPLSRSSLVSVALFAAGALSVVGYGYITRDEAARVVPSAPAAHQPSMATPLVQAYASETPAQPSTPPADETPPGNEKAPAVVTRETVSSWIAQATGADAARRAAAIDALGTAPKAQALPALAQVLETADESDRPRALRSLRTLAQRQGDEDDRIRSVVRKIVYHGGDEDVVQTAQAALQDIERDLTEAGSSVRR
jgi:hypothetical protein